MNKTFCNLIRDIVEVYVDDIVVKTKVGSTLVEDLSLVFDRLRATRTKLNPEKCIFGISAGKLLGFLVSHRGIEANPAKIKAIEAMRPLGRIKDVQKLAGSLAAFSRFISRLAERALPFFKLLRKSGPFSWTEEAEQAFQELKLHLTSLPVLVAPEPGETLFLYLAASAEAVSMVLVAERTEQTRQGDTRVSPAKYGEPDPRHGGPSASPLPEAPEPGQEGPEEPRTSGNPGPLGPKDLMWRIRANRTRSPGSGPSKSQSTTSAKSFTRRRPGILRRISSSTRYLLRPGNCATTFRHTELS
jgi:hypothetical protein